MIKEGSSSLDKTGWQQVFFDIFVMFKVQREFCPQNCKIGRNYTRKTYFPKISQQKFAKNKHWWQHSQE
jgi:hypothetical protein